MGDPGRLRGRGCGTKPLLSSWRSTAETWRAGDEHCRTKDVCSLATVTRQQVFAGCAWFL